MALQISPEKTRIGWIGTGVMGRSMCGHLIAAGYKVVLYSRTKDKAADLLSKGAAVGRFAARGGGRSRMS